MFRLSNRIEYDVTIQKPALQYGICEHVRVHACAKEITSDMLRAACSLMYALRCVYDLQQNGFSIGSIDSFANDVKRSESLAEKCA